MRYGLVREEKLPESKKRWRLSMENEVSTIKNEMALLKEQFAELQGQLTSAAAAHNASFSSTHYEGFKQSKVNNPICEVFNDNNNNVRGVPSVTHSVEGGNPNNISIKLELNPSSAGTPSKSLVSLGTRLGPYYPTRCQDPVRGYPCYLHSITHLHQYANKSFEELRYEDYKFEEIKPFLQEASGGDFINVKPIQTNFEHYEVKAKPAQTNLSEVKLNEALHLLQNVTSKLSCVSTRLSALDFNMSKVWTSVSRMDSRLSEIDLFMVMQRDSFNKQWQVLESKLSNLENTNRNQADKDLQFQHPKTDSPTSNSGSSAATSDNKTPAEELQTQVKQVDKDVPAPSSERSLVSAYDDKISLSVAENVSVNSTEINSNVSKENSVVDSQVKASIKYQDKDPSSQSPLTDKLNSVDDSVSAACDNEISSEEKSSTQDVDKNPFFSDEATKDMVKPLPEETILEENVYDVLVKMLPSVINSIKEMNVIGKSPPHLKENHSESNKDSSKNEDNNVDPQLDLGRKVTADPGSEERCIEKETLGTTFVENNLKKSVIIEETNHSREETLREADARNSSSMNIAKEENENDQPNNDFSDIEHGFVIIEKADLDDLADVKEMTNQEAMPTESTSLGTESAKAYNNITEYLEVNYGVKKDMVYEFGFEAKPDSPVLTSASEECESNTQNTS